MLRDAIAAAAIVVLGCHGRGGTMAQDGDAQVIEQLRQAGSDLSKPHAIEFFLYLPNEAKAREASTQLQAQGYETSVRQGATGSEWLCLATKSMVPTHMALLRAREELGVLASRLEGEYDGWGAPIVK